MEELTAIEKSRLKTELTQNIIPVVGKTNKGRLIDLPSAVSRSISNQKKYFPGYPVNSIYQNKLGGSRSNIYNYYVREFKGLLQQHKILKPEKTVKETLNGVASSAGSKNIMLILLAVLGYLFLR